MTHTDALTRFRSGEPRLLVARHRSSAELVVMEDGDANRWRAMTREHLRCPLTRCLSPELTTVSRRAGADSFRHLVGTGGHRPEHLFYWQATQMLAAWVRRQHPRAEVRVGERSAATGGRLADVLVTFRSGRRMVFVVQFSPLRPDAWRAKHEMYRRLGIRDVWLFGHTGPQLPQVRKDDGLLMLTAAHRAVAAAGLPLLWVNPVTRQIATAVTDVTLGTRQSGDVPAAARRARLTVDDMGTFQLDEAVGLTSERLRRLAINKKAAAAWVAGGGTQDEALAARQVQIAATAGGSEEAWMRSPERSRVLAAHGGMWPEFLAVPSTCAVDIPLPSEQWQAQLFAALIEGRPRGTVVSSQYAAELLGVRLISGPECREVIREWLFALVGFGWVRVEAVSRGHQTFRFRTSRPGAQSPRP